MEVLFGQTPNDEEEFVMNYEKMQVLVLRHCSASVELVFPSSQNFAAL